MKIPRSIRAGYESQHDAYLRLQKEVQTVLKPVLSLRWHYEDRIKELESFTQKIESGRIDDPSKVEDFFACTVVVPNSATIPEAERRVRSLFDLLERRPPDAVLTRVFPESFPFDDLRLYVRIRQDPALPPTEITNLPFEIQIKTFLLHAWAIATHDLTYKADAIHWGKERVAAQIRAMLEHAEASIMQVEALAVTESLKRSTQRIDEIQLFITFLKETWPAGSLPVSIKSLAESIWRLCTGANVSLEDLRRALEVESAAGRGVHYLDLSPYAVVVQTMVNRNREQLLILLRDPKQRNKFFIPAEVDLPAGLDLAACRNAVCL